MEIRTAIFLDEDELQAIIARHLAAMAYRVDGVDFELEYANGTYRISGARIMATPVERQES